MTKEKTLRILSGDRFHNRGWESEMDSRVSDIMRGMRNATRKDIEEI